MNRTRVYIIILCFITWLMWPSTTERNVFVEWKSMRTSSLRYATLWSVQGLGDNDSEGGMQDAQAQHIIKQLDEITKSGRSLKHFCETGFWRGGSSLLWLLYSPDTIVHSFDIAANPSATSWLKQQFPDRFFLHVGDSKKTIPEFAKDHSGWCDLVLVDGDHSGEGPYHDLVNFKAASHTRTVVFADDTFDTVRVHSSFGNEFNPIKHDPSMCWTRALKEKIIRPLPEFGPMCDVFGKSGRYFLGHCLACYDLK